MGINLEYATLLASLKHRQQLPSRGRVLEFGAQDISADPGALALHTRRCGLADAPPSFESAKKLYQFFGFDDYTCIDASAEHGALPYDLNRNLRTEHDFRDTYDLVTDLGTFEHCFDVTSAFRNAHEACRSGGLMIHALPSAGNTNHGYYTIQPRMLADIATANGYEILEFAFTVDYGPALYSYELKNYQAFDDRDLMVYVVFRKVTDTAFRLPFDSIFTEKNTLAGYARIFSPKSFSSYIKGTWSNIRPARPDMVPTQIKSIPHRRRVFFKRLIDYLGGLN